MTTSMWEDRDVDATPVLDAQSYARPGCSAASIVHGCAGPLCAVGHLEDDKRVVAQGYDIDLTPHVKPILVAALRAAAALISGRQDKMSQSQTDWQATVENSIKGVATEYAYALWAGWPTAKAGASRRSEPDFVGPDGPIDVKFAKRRTDRMMAFTVNDGTWAREKDDEKLRYAAVSLDGWKATVLGHISVPQVREAGRAGLLQRHKAHYRTDGSGYFEVRCGLLTPVVTA